MRPLRALRSVLVFVAVLLLPEAAARLVYRARHGAWPISLAATADRARSEVGALFLEHSILPFVLRPGARVDFMDTHAQINASGFRGRELRPNTPLRILVVGGSTVFDTGVPDNDTTWPALLERGLEPSLPGVEVVNAGIPIYMIWTNYLKYVFYDRDVRPDVVLIYQGVNDTVPWWPAAYDEMMRKDYWLFRGTEARAWAGIQGERKLSQDPILPGILARSVFFRGAYNERGRNESVFANMTRARTVDESMPDAFLDRNLDILRRLVDAVRADGALPILVPQTIGSLSRKQVAGENFPIFVGGLRKLNESYVRYARGAGVKVIDVTSVGDEWGDDHFKDLFHFSATGSRELAQLLAQDISADEAIRRLHALHRQREEMPTRIFDEPRGRSAF
jgi:lysophospholipase L1-like esterase